MISYLSYFKLRFITNLQYRMEAVAGICTQLFFALVYIMIYLAYYESGGNPPLEWQELVNYLWLQQAFFALIYPFDRETELLNMIKNGNLAYQLVRPQDFYFKWYIKMLSKRLVTILLRFMPILILATLLPYPFHLSSPYSVGNLIIFIIALILGLFLVTSLNLFMHILTMFTLDEKGTLITYNVVAEILTGSTIPIPFFPIWLQKIAEFLPFRFIGDFPFRIYSNSITLEEGYILILGSIIWIIIITLIGYLVSRISLKKAVIQGG